MVGGILLVQKAASCRLCSAHAIDGDRELGRRIVGLGILAFVVCFTQTRVPCCFLALGRRLMLVRPSICVCVTLCQNNRLENAYTSSRCE